MAKILIIEDEESYREATASLLEAEGFEVVVAADGEEGLEEFERGGADLILLDLMMPGMPGLDVCRAIRAQSSVPVIMVTARGEDIDKVIGLEIGADDYITKPYFSRELVARINAVLRRGSAYDFSTEVLAVNDVRMDVERHEVTVAGQLVKLALKEFELLEIFMRNSGRVMTRGQLIDRVWGPDYVGDTKTLDVHVKRLRSKIEKDPSSPKRLITVRGLGYKYEG